ncbi:P-loop containing nucleoside triphosphate hydrolase protein [Dichomitus squalens LYAD-421 SS1]|uniref:DNA 3'-5' helicase n=1 Tax=Dichomitus squalens (strain LYAD-421) TaxID=732165 RepID=R7T1I3_DICSQ|nr:P-loop containing nucleoside triphosphate hydrolase protein [Dichomitus squalens LYAD-421 SS1]EJF61027.1 P-loop containing nucleoside triphosphate hydrolase protein [Dichomitus squalens LYAD-421 SS1]
MRDAYRWDADPKEFQLRAVQAQIEGTDMIVQAPTGAGKTAIAAGPHLWAGNEKRFTLMVCPLLALEEEMCQTFLTDFGLRAIALNSKNGACSPEAIKAILAHEYQVILVSPEMLQSRTFMNRILRNSRFMKRIISMFVDEAHCIVLWGTDFRKKYGTLGKVRAFLPRGTPVIAVSATLTPRVVRAIWASLHFAQSDTQSHYCNEGNDRANVSIVVRACEHPLNSYADLSFVIPPTLRSITDIPKTYVYVDSIATGGEIIDYLNGLLDKHFDLLTASEPDRARFRGVVRPFNATLSHRYRTLAMSRFRDGNIRVLVCTDAAGMGCNIPDIDRVIQWKLPATFSHYIQRAGRAARGRDRTGIAIMLVERSAYNTDLGPSLNQGEMFAHSKSKAKIRRAIDGDDRVVRTVSKEKRNKGDIREYALAHGLARGGSARQDAPLTGVQPHTVEDSPDEGLLAFVQSTSCRRQVWARIFDNPHPLAPVVPCCDICSPSLFDRARPPLLPPESRARNLKRGEPDLCAQDKLRNWRNNIFGKHHPSAQYDATSVLDDELILMLVSHGPLESHQALNLIKDKWPFHDTHGVELGMYVATLEIKFSAIPSKTRAQNAPPSTPILERRPISSLANAQCKPSLIPTLWVQFANAGNTTCASSQLDWYTSVVGESPCVTYQRLRQICNNDYQVPTFRTNTPGDQCDDQVASCCCNTVAFQLSMLCMNCQYDTQPGDQIGIDAGVGAYTLYRQTCGAGTNHSLPDDIQSAVCNLNIRLDNYLYGGWDDGSW